MTEVSAVLSATFEQQYGIKLPPCPITIEFLQAVIDKRHVTVVDPVDSRNFRWYCSCSQRGKSKQSRHVAVSGGLAHEKAPNHRNSRG